MAKELLFISIMKNKLALILRFVVSFGLILLLAWIMRKDASDVLGILKTSNKVFIAIAVFINIPLTILVAYRLKLLMSGQNVFLSIKDAVYLTFIGYFFNNFLPTAIGGDIVKAHYASKKTNNKAGSYAAVLTDRMLGLIATLLVALAGLIFIGKDLHNKLIAWVVLFVFLLTVLMIMFLLKKNDAVEKAVSAEKGLFNTIKDKLSKLYAAINFYRNSPTVLVKGIALSLALQALSITSVYLLTLCTGGDISLFRLFLIIPLVWAVSMLPSLNGLGVREGAFVYFLKGYVGAEKAFAVSLLWLGLIMLYSAIGGALQLLYPMKIGLPETKN